MELFVQIIKHFELSAGVLRNQGQLRYISWIQTSNVKGLTEATSVVFTDNGERG